MLVDAGSQQRLISLLRDKAARLRIHSIRSTTAAGSGHPTSSASAADIVSVLFFSVMRYDPRQPANPKNDIFVLSKGHAAPVLYAAWAEAGAFAEEELLKLRTLDSDLEGHPTPRLPFVGVATGSLGQGLSAGLGMALNAKKLEGSDQRIYVLLGDGESAEGSVWEAAAIAAHYGLDNLCATVDVNRLGQSEPALHHDEVERWRAKWSAFGWNAVVVDGHDIQALLDAYQTAASTGGRPTVVLARTVKGKGIPGVEGVPGHHGKPLDREKAEEAVRHLEQQLSANPETWRPQVAAARGSVKPRPASRGNGSLQPPYGKGDAKVATRRAFGEALAALGKLDPRIVVLDGDVKNSTYTEIFEKQCSDRFFQMYIAEQNMVGAAMGFSAVGKVPFAATFACFLSRAYDFIRMAAIGNNNVKLAGSHAGVSIGEDGPSQMGLEDLAMFCAQPNFTVLYPCDAVSAWQATKLLAELEGPGYLRTARLNTPIVYDSGEAFSVGRCKVLRSSDRDSVTVVAAGVTVFEALAAWEQLQAAGVAIRVIDLFSVQPVDRDTLIRCARATQGRVITVEDHYAHGGIGDAVLAALSGEKVALQKLAVREIPHSGQPAELMDRYGISARHIVEAARNS